MPESLVAPTETMRAFPRKRRRRPHRREARLWRSITAIGVIGVMVAVAALATRHYLIRDRAQRAVEIAGAVPVLPHALTAARQSPPAVREPEHQPAPAVTPKQPTRQRPQPVTVDGIRYRTAPAGATALMAELASAPEFGLERSVDDPLVKTLIDNARRHAEPSRQFHPLAMALDDVHNLPLRVGEDCQLAPLDAQTLQARSRTLREYLARSTDARTLRYRLYRADTSWEGPDVVPTLVQMLQPETHGLRQFLIAQLTRIPGPEASRALARRAIFDTSPDLRHAALDGLRTRSRQDYREIFVDGLRHPWPPVAEFAAAALVELNDRSSVATLVPMLDEDPSGPFAVTEGASRTYHVREMVRINHLRNCVVCHATSFDESHLVRASIPDPKRPLPPAFTPAYYKPDRDRLFVRADVTYLKQDFSVPLAVDSPGPWPWLQRFDFCVRTRRLTSEEYEAMTKSPRPNPQREAILFALRELTGMDPGETSTEWRQALSRH